MNQKNVPDLELCQELDRLCKEKNITIPKTEFYWCFYNVGGWILHHTNQSCDKNVTERIPAPLVSEQGEWLPAYLMIKGKRYMPKQYQAGKLRFYGYEHTEFNLLIQNGNTESNARQKMINYGLAEGIITTL
jgi:hypothetical protein